MKKLSKNSNKQTLIIMLCSIIDRNPVSFQKEMEKLKKLKNWRSKMKSYPPTLMAMNRI